MKIVHLITGLGVGGAENVVLNLAKSQLAAGYQVEVISLRRRLEMLPFFKEAGIEVIVLGMNPSLRSMRAGTRAAIKYVRLKKPQIIHAHLAHAGLLATFLKWKFPDIRLVFTSHNVVIADALVTGLVRITKYWRDADIIFSPAQLRSFNIAERAHVIANGVPLSGSTASGSEPPPAPPFRFVAVGRLEPVKNHQLLLNIAASLKSKYHFTIDIFGEGVMRSALEDQIRDKELQQIIYLKGNSSCIPEELPKYHGFLMPSLWEGLPISILEAGMARLPVLATAVGSVADVLDETNSYVCDLADFQDQLICLMGDYDLALKKASRLHQHILEHYVFDTVAEKHLALYKSLLT